jgi:hypothetical protein
MYTNKNHAFLYLIIILYLYDNIIGQTIDSLGTVNHILNNNELSMVLHAGDLSYADCNARKWDIYGELIGMYLLMEVFMSICMCICMCIFICIYIYIYMYICKFTIYIS